MVEFFLAGVPTSPATSRALAATLADWGHESRLASSFWRRALVTATSGLAILRALVGAAVRELPGEVRSPFLLRTLAGSTGVIVVLAYLMPASRFAGVVPWHEFVWLSVVSATIPVLIMLPLTVFVAECLGASRRAGPTLASLLALAGVVVLFQLIVLPEAITTQRQATWFMFANAATPAPPPVPSLVRLLTGGPVAHLPSTYWWTSVGLAVTFSVLCSCLAVLGCRIRKLGGGPRWTHRVTPALICAGTVAAIAVAVGVVLWPPISVLFPYRPQMLAVVFVLATVGALALASVLTRKTEGVLAS